MLSTESCDISCEPRMNRFCSHFRMKFSVFFLEIIIDIKYKFSFLILTRNGQRLRLPSLYVCDCVCVCVEHTQLSPKWLRQSDRRKSAITGSVLPSIGPAADAARPDQYQCKGPSLLLLLQCII